ncbi:MAG: hypothetical protein JRJ87_19625 [Deltaproteobacteria bacterium]|nr:hypothetical protein [Deltaproteobacteria bacterium]
MISQSRLILSIVVLIASLACVTCQDYGNSTCSNGPTGASFKVINDSGATQYVYQRSHGFYFDFYAQKGDAWEIFLPEIGCHTNCDGCTNECFGGCTPVLPEFCAPHIETIDNGASKDFKWDGKRTESQYNEFPECYCSETSENVQCLNEWAAQSGSYMVNICYSEDYIVLDDGCGGDHRRGDLDNPTCLEVVFDYDLCDRVPIEIRIP